MNTNNYRTLKLAVQFHDEYRNLVLSRKYYSRKLIIIKRSSFWIEILLAISSSSSLASIFAVIKFSWYTWIPSFFSAVVALVAVVKPLLGLDKEIERLAKLASKFTELSERARRIEDQILIDAGISPELLDRVLTIQGEIDRLTGDEDLKPNRKVLSALQAEVQQEIPVSSLWCPLEVRDIDAT